jgi:hypothetical protein
VATRANELRLRTRRSRLARLSSAFAAVFSAIDAARSTKDVAVLGRARHSQDNSVGVCNASVAQPSVYGTPQMAGPAEICLTVVSTVLSVSSHD